MSSDKSVTYDVAPYWRAVHTVSLMGETVALVGDPHAPLVPLSVTLSPGIWVWESRDANLAGESGNHVWEVRLRRRGVVVSDDWDWCDAAGTIHPRPVPGAQVLASRPVDTATLAWRLVPAELVLSGKGYDSSAELYSVRSARAFDDGRVFISPTGFGDGGYPIAVRHDSTDPAGEIVEVRACFHAANVDPDAVAARELAVSGSI